MKTFKFILVTLFLLSCSQGTLEELTSEEIYVEGLMDILEERSGTDYYQVSLSRWMPLDEFRNLIGNEDSFVFTQVFSMMPGVGDLRFTLDVVENDISNEVFDEELLLIYEDFKVPQGALGWDLSESLRERLAIGAEQTVSVGGFKAYGDVEELLDWWIENTDEVRLVQPNPEGDFANVIRFYAPDEEIQ